MSRVGRMPIPLPGGVEVRIEGRKVTVKGPKGELSHTLPESIEVVREGDELRVERRDESRSARSLHGLNRTLLANMVQGVTAGFEKALELHGTGYRASKSGQSLVLSVGYSHPVEIAPPPGISFEVPSVTSVVVRGADKQQVGAVAANIRAVREPEPYLGKGIRYAGERIRRKEGKTGK